MTSTASQPIRQGSVPTAAASEAAIRRIIDARAAAVHAGHVDAMMADVAEDVVMFDLVDPLRRKGKALSHERAVQWLETYDGPPSWENRDVIVATDGDVGFSFSLSHVAGTLKTGSPIDMWFRNTLGFRRTGGRWQIVHDHGSVPFDPASGKASLALQPEQGDDHDE